MPSVRLDALVIRPFADALLVELQSLKRFNFKSFLISSYLTEFEE